MSPYYQTQLSSPPGCIYRIWDAGSELENIYVANSSGQPFFIWSRIYSRLGGFEGKRTPRQRTTSNELPTSSALQVKILVPWACESLEAWSNIDIGLEIECREHVAASIPHSCRRVILISTITPVNNTLRGPHRSELRWMYRKCIIQR